MNHLKKNAPYLLAGLLLLTCVGIVVATNYQSFFGASSTIGGSPLDSEIRKGEAVIRTHPSVAKPYLTLASLYLQKSRETSDSSYYTKIIALMESAEKLEPENPDIQATLASVSLGRHDFQGAKMYIDKAISRNDYVAAYYGLLGDADIELGRYREAVDAYQKMVNIRPSFNSWSRIAYVRELYGDTAGAQIALEEAINAGSAYPENIAWAYVELGKLQLRSDTEKAKESFTTALAILPTYSQAKEGFGKVSFAQNDVSEAEKQFTAAYNLLPLAQYSTDLGDLYLKTGDTVKAAQQYALTEAAFAQSRKGGVNTDLEEALFLADHDLRLTEALSLAESAYQKRPSMSAADTYAWALFKNGKIQEALRLRDAVFTLGMNDAGVLYHQAQIAKGSGDTVQAKKYVERAYVVSPYPPMQYAEDLEELRGALK